LTSFSSFACKCKATKTIKEEYKSVDFVLVGKILSIDTISVLDSNLIASPTYNRIVHELPRQSIQVVHYKLELTKTYKGVITKKLINIYSAPSDETCGFIFTVGNSYIVYGSKNTTMYFDDIGNYTPPNGENIVWVTRCGRTKLSNQEEIKVLDSI